ncbi:unnamed protein product [Meloidogyne enterolobii]|uniref:Uncharacterized protein n=1 Tax=Meloidogyne enterolobii TaxID=390850 RepID=A0ACB0Z3E6_MELEN
MREILFAILANQLPLQLNNQPLLYLLGRHRLVNREKKRTYYSIEIKGSKKNKRRRGERLS